MVVLACDGAHTRYVGVGSCVGSGHCVGRQSLCAIEKTGMNGKNHSQLECLKKIVRFKLS